MNTLSTFQSNFCSKMTHIPNLLRHTSKKSSRKSDSYSYQYYAEHYATLP